MTMLEQLARALAVADHKDPDASAWVRLPGGYSEGVCWRDQYLPKARAMLQVLRDPTPEMIEAGEYDDLSPPGEDGRYIDADMAEACFRRMIDVAMEGGE